MFSLRLSDYMKETNLLTYLHVSKISKLSSQSNINYTITSFSITIDIVVSYNRIVDVQDGWLNPGCDASAFTWRLCRRKRGDKKNQTDSRKDEQTSERANINEQQGDERRQGDEQLQRETRDEVRMEDEFETRREPEMEEVRRNAEREKEREKQATINALRAHERQRRDEENEELLGKRRELHGIGQGRREGERKMSQQEHMRNVNKRRHDHKRQKPAPDPHHRDTSRKVAYATFVNTKCTAANLKR